MTLASEVDALAARIADEIVARTLPVLEASEDESDLPVGYTGPYFQKDA